jgi:serine/threonine protein kinase
MTGRDNGSNVIYAIDFGLSKRWRDSKTRQHIPFRDGKTLIGTARYTSINTHLGIEQSRRDDLECLAYVLIYLLKGGLPWQGLKAETRHQKHEMISEMKIVTAADVLCHGIPGEFGTFLSHVRHLDFADTPNYAHYRRIFRDLFVREGFVFDYQYDWIAKAQPVGFPLMFTQQDSEPTAPPLLAASRHTNPSAPVLPTLPQRMPSAKIVTGALPERPVMRLSRRIGTTHWMLPPRVKPPQKVFQS